MKRRYLETFIQQDALADKKIAFLTGPRQVGKTTIAQAILEDMRSPQNYFSWDDDEFRKIWIKNPKVILEGKKAQSLFVFDEIHKDRKWKQRLKGVYDLNKKDYLFLVTGSAKLGYYRKSGDSLQGRYIPYRLHPFSYGESDAVKAPPSKDWEEFATHSYDYETLLEFGGFPEPFLSQNLSKTQRWRRLYRERMIREDLRDLQNIRDITLIENLSLLLQDRAAGQLSYESLKEDVSTSFDTVRRWIELLEAVYYCYRIKPYSKNIKNSLKKEPKLFLYDWSLIQEKGPRRENLIASHLLKSCHAWTDCAYGEFDLFYVRDKQKREVDFLVTNKGKPYALIEVKSNTRQISPSLIHYNKLLKPNFCIQVVENEKYESKLSMENPNIRVMSTQKFLSGLV